MRLYINELSSNSRRAEMAALLVKGFIGGGPADPVEVKRGETLLNDAAHHLDAHLAGREWVAGPQLSLADIALAAPLMSTVPAKLPVTQFTNLQAWYSRVQALNTWRQAS